MRPGPQFFRSLSRNAYPRTHLCVSSPAQYMTDIPPTPRVSVRTRSDNRNNCDNCGLRVLRERVPSARSAVHEDPKNITWLYGEGVRDRGQWSPKDQGRGGGRDTVQRVCRDRRHVESLCRDSSCAMCVVCCKRDAARHTAQPRDAMLFCKS